jgi:hypothetical protein
MSPVCGSKAFSRSDLDLVMTGDTKAQQETVETNEALYFGLDAVHFVLVDLGGQVRRVATDYGESSAGRKGCRDYGDLSNCLTYSVVG